MRENKGTHQLEMRRQRGSEHGKHRWERTKAHTFCNKGWSEDCKDRWGQAKHTPTRDEETEGDLRTVHTNGEDKSTHSLVTKRGLRMVNTGGEEQKHSPTRDEETKGGCEVSKYRWRSIKAHTS